MNAHKVEGEGYTVEHNARTHQIIFIGTIRLRTTDEYSPVMELLDRAHDTAIAADSPLTLDFRQLQFLNSSGINTVSRFVISARKLDQTTLIVQGSSGIYWQKKSLTNLQRLWSKIQVQIQ
ncbi:MAG: hypothetical protein GY803_19845 [Chloroflexi bacterium]|nr:hypothetical protein [Chloroflexota bacterium]